jgi:ParB/RepB/Spo0J family partition protein
VTLASIPLAFIRESKTNPRKTFDPVQLDDLVASVRQFGVLQPILVRPRPCGGCPGCSSDPKDCAPTYELVAGARRFRAAAAAGLAEIPAMVHELDDGAALEVQVIENLQRQDLGLLEEARGFELLHRDHGYEVADLAAKVGKSTSYVYSRLQLCKLPPKAVELIEGGKLSAGHALLLARIPSPAVAEKAALEWADGRFGQRTVAEARRMLETRFMLQLASAPFDTTDAELVPATGPCGTCPKRTGCQRGLFADELEDDDLCTDAECFAAKVVAGYALARADAERAGVQVLPKSKSQSYEFVRLEDVCTDDPKGRTYRQLLGGRKGIAGVEGRVLAQRMDGGAEWRFPRKKLAAAMRKAGHDFRKVKAAPASSSKAAAEQRDHDASVAIYEAKRTALAVAAKSRGESAASDLLAWALANCGVFENEAFRNRWGVKVGAHELDVDWKAAGRPFEELVAIFVDLSVGYAWHGIWQQMPNEVRELAKMLGVDLEAVEKRARDELAAPKPKPPAPTTKRPKAKKGKAAAAGGERDA